MKRGFSWISSYLEYTKDQESPELFHYWSGLGVIASVLGRNVFIKKSYDPNARLFPNIYMILVAPSGKCRKGGALGMAYRILRETGVKVYVEAITKRALTQALADEIVVVEGRAEGESKLTIWSEELEVFLGKDAILTGLFALLTRLYDCPDKWEYSTASQGIDNLYNVCLNIIGGTIPAWFSELPTSVMNSGFLARIIIVCQDKTPRKEPGLRIDKKKLDQKKKLETDLIEFLVKLKEVKRELYFTPEAINFYDSWYLDRDEVKDERFASFYEREHDHLIKIAMLLSASYGDLFNSDVISVDRLKEAIIALDKVKGYMSLAYSGIGDSVGAKGYERIYRYIVEEGGEIEHSRLMNKSWYWVGDKEGFNKVIELLVETGKIRIKVTKTGKKVYSVTKEVGR